MKIVTIVGARPQFIKAAVISRAIADQNQKSSKLKDKIEEVILHTGQHYDENMSDVFFKELHLPKPTHFLDINCLSHGAMTGQMIEKIESVLITEKPDVVIVYGDTNSTLAGAIAASKLHIPVAHIEAGLRSFNRRMPEEINRVLTDHTSTFLFCPTVEAVKNLQAEGVEKAGQKIKNEKRFVACVGDVMLDAALYYKQFAEQPNWNVPDKFILATIHRQENTDNPQHLKNIFSAFYEIAEKMPIVIPLHPRTKEMLVSLNLTNFPEEKIKFVAPVSYRQMVYLLENCNFVMTDSGGLQKEAFFFKKYCLTLRDETEWLELVDCGCNKLTGVSKQSIINGFNSLLSLKLDFPDGLYGHGCSGAEIVNILKNHFIKI